MISLAVLLWAWVVHPAAAQGVLSEPEIRSQIVGKTFLLGDGRIIRYDANGDFAAINGQGYSGRGRWTIAGSEICVEYTGINMARRCFTFSRLPDGLRVTDRDRTNQLAIPAPFDMASLGSVRTLSACEHNVRYTLTPPAADVPANVRAFSGAWTGKWESGLCAALFVQQVLADGTARLVVGWGSHLGRKPGSMGLIAMIRGTTLTAINRSEQWVYTLVTPSELDARYHAAGVTSGKLTRQ
jgi:hypothetical protein